MSAVSVSIIIPALNEEGTLVGLLEALQGLPATELIVVDGGSSDNTVAEASPLADIVLQSEPGRARQMNAGASYAQGEWLWFLHADSELTTSPADYLSAILACQQWGFFRLRLSGSRWSFRIIETLANARIWLTRVATGDTGVFVKRSAFAQVGGFEDIPLMEDVALSKRLRQRHHGQRPPIYLQSASRRWEQRGVIRTVALMWQLRLLYVLGVSPATLAKMYR